MFGDDDNDHVHMVLDDKVNFLCFFPFFHFFQINSLSFGFVRFYHLTVG